MVIPANFPEFVGITNFYTGKQVVILVDEYDKPLLNAADDESLSEIFRNMLKPVYGNLKTMDRYIKFAMLESYP